MKFKSWLQLNEMPHFSVQDKMSIPCRPLIAAGMEIPCVSDKQIGMIDMRFEFYPGDSPARKLGPYGKFVAPIPDSTQFLVFDSGRTKLMFGNVATQQGILPEDEKAYSVSPQGFMLLPPDWLKYAILLDPDYNVIKQ